MADISKIQIESGVYDIKDETARNQISNIGNKKILFIGDSYLAMDNGTTGVIDYFKTISGISNVIYNVYNGIGFVYTVDAKNFLTLLNDVPNDNEVTDIIVCGGYNDQYVNPKGDIYTAIRQFCINAKNKFPKATVYIGMVGFTLEENKRYPIFEVYTQYSQCNRIGGVYLNGVECVMHDTSLFAGGGDLTHPKEMGREMLASAIYQAWKNGYYQMIYNFTQIPLHFTNATGGDFNLYATIMNNQTQIAHQGPETILFANHPSYSDIHQQDIEIATLDLNQNGSLISPWPYNNYSIPVTCAVEDASGYRTMNGKLEFIGNKIKLVFEDVETQNWTDIVNLNSIEINSFQCVIPTQMI